MDVKVDLDRFPTAGNTISGNWTLTGSPGCTGSGTFTTTKM